MTVAQGPGDRRRVVRSLLLCALALAASACKFEPPALAVVQPTPAVLGAACMSDQGCASAICGARQVCDECRVSLTCGADRACDDTGRCVDVQVTGQHRHVPAIGARSTNGVHTHVGRVGVAAVTSSRELR